MAIYSDAAWDPIENPNGGFWINLPPLRPIDKIIHHRTQGSSYPRSTYVAKGGIPHFTVRKGQVWQHYDTDAACRALYDIPELPARPNRDGTIQIEVVGFSGVTDQETAKTVAKLCQWIESIYHIPTVWPMGRPPEGGAVNAPDLTFWWSNPGHYGHSQCPENRDAHWDPAYTDDEWPIINAREQGVVMATPIGGFDKLVDLGNGTIQVQGWALDPDVPNDSIMVHFYVNGKAYGVFADRERTDVNEVMKVGGKHGVDAIIKPDNPYASVSLEVGMYGIDATGNDNALIGTRKGVMVLPASVGAGSGGLSEAQVRELIKQELIRARIAPGM